MGGAFACGVTPAGAGYCWGNNPDGQIGDSTTQLRSVPTLVWGGLAFAHIDAGGDHACGLTTMGALYCWGAGGGGELGDGNATSSPVPVAVAGNLIARSVDAGGYQNAASARSCAITTAGAAYCWGEALTGAAGVASSATPVAVDGGLAFNQISVGSYHVCAAAVSGAGYCWGYQLYGSLGTGSPSSADVPTPVAAPRPQ